MLVLILGLSTATSWTREPKKITYSNLKRSPASMYPQSWPPLFRFTPIRNMTTFNPKPSALSKPNRAITNGAATHNMEYMWKFLLQQSLQDSLQILSTSAVGIPRILVHAPSMYASIPVSIISSAILPICLRRSSLGLRDLLGSTVSRRWGGFFYCVPGTVGLLERPHPHVHEPGILEPALEGSGRRGVTPDLWHRFVVHEVEGALEGRAEGVVVGSKVAAEFGQFDVAAGGSAAGGVREELV